MRLSRVRFPWLMIISLAIAADLLALGVWAIRPTRISTDGLGLAGRPEDAPILRLLGWPNGQYSPTTPAGLLSLFDFDELLLAAVLALPLPLLAALLALRRPGGRMRLGLDRPVSSLRPIPLRFRVTTALTAVAVAGLYLGWEVQAWKTWRLRGAYLQRALASAASEADAEARLRANREKLARLESGTSRSDALARPELGYDRSGTALAAEKAVTRLWLGREARHLSALVAAHAARRLKYERAAENPRAAVAADATLPEPEPDASYLAAQKDYARALAAYDELSRAQPDYVEAHLEGAWIRATCPDPRFRDGRRAVASATRACDLTHWSDTGALGVLAAAFAEAGAYSEAVRWQRKALLLAPGGSEAKEIRERLVLYETGRPYRMD